MAINLAAAMAQRVMHSDDIWLDVSSFLEAECISTDSDQGHRTKSGLDARRRMRAADRPAYWMRLAPFHLHYHWSSSHASSIVRCRVDTRTER